MPIELSQVANSFSRSHTLRLKDNNLEKVGVWGKFKMSFHPGKSAKEIEKVGRFILASGSEEASLAFMARYKDKKGQVRKIIQRFERDFVKDHPELPYLNTLNLENLKKWNKTGLHEELYKKHPEIHDFLVESRLLSQIRVTRDPLQEVNNEPCLLVEGVLTPLAELLERFQVIKSPRYQEKFILEHSTGKIFTYLDNGEGLQPHNPYINALSPIARLSDEEYETTLETAQKYVRPTDNAEDNVNHDRTFIIQIVSSYVPGKDTEFNKLITRSKHPYLRLVAGQDNDEMNVKKGDVIEVGFNWKKKISLPFETTEGRFRSPDRWEYLPVEERVVTNVAITEDEALSFFNFTKKYHNQETNLGQPIGFNLSKQNCSVFVNKALQSANIEAPTEITLEKLIKKVSPLWAQKVEKFVSRSIDQSREVARKVLIKLPGPLRTAIFKVDNVIRKVSNRIFRSLLALILAPIRLITGGAKGKTDVSAFVKDGEKPETLIPPSTNPKNLTKLSSYSYHLPGVLQNWQRKQPSTIIYKAPTKLSMVPN